MIDRAILLREGGMSISRIAQELGIPRSTIGDWVRGIDPLPQLHDESLPSRGGRKPPPGRPPLSDAEQKRLQSLRKACSRCLEVKPWSAYWVASYWPDGTVRRPQAACKECVKARRRKRRKEDPEWAREIDRKQWQWLKADPVRYARHRQSNREALVVWRLRQREEKAA